MNNTTVTGPEVINTIQLLQTLGVIAFVFLSALGIVWCLKKMGGRMTADIQANVKKQGARLAITGTGLIGTYLSIVTFEFSGIFMVVHFILR